MSRESPFDMHRGWTHGAERLANAIHRRDKDALNELPQVEILPDDEEVGAHLRESHPDKLNASPEEVERLLMDDLWMIYASDDGDDTEREAQKDCLRRLIWKNSQHLNKSESPEAALLAAIRLEREAEAEQAYAESSGIEQAEEADDRHARIVQLKETLALNIRGDGHGTNDDLRPILDTIEGEYTSALHTAAHGFTEKLKEQAAKDLSDLRLIRDEIYLRHLFPNQAKLRDRAETQSARHRRAA